MVFRVAKQEELNSITKLYQQIIKDTPELSQFARWIWNMHPTEAQIKEYLFNEELYILEEQDNIIGAVALTMQQGEDYHEISWKVDAADDEVATLHILGIQPEYQGKGLGNLFINEIIKLVRKTGKLVIRLDALASNTPAQKLYQKNGFVYRGKQHLHALNTGWTDFYYYEYIL